MSFGPRFSLILAIALLGYSCQHEPNTSEDLPLVQPSIPCDYIHEVDGYVDCIYRMNPDTQSIMLEPLEAGIPDLTRFDKLTTLWITSNGSYRMEILNPEILKLKSLKHLIFSKSKLASIPEEIIQLENLETLTVAAGWSLKKLPSNLSQLKKLRVLNVWRNDLNGDSLDFSGMDALELVVIGENERVDIRRLKRKWPRIEIIDYYGKVYLR